MYTLSRWTRDSNYIGEDFSGWYVLYGRNRDSDSLTNCNFQACCDKLGIDPDDDTKDTPTRKVVRSSHWAAGWVEWVGFHESDSEAMEIAEEIIESLNNYPVLDEDSLVSAEQSEAEGVWKSGYTWRDRLKYIRENYDQFSFEKWTDVLAEVRGDRFSGYASELIN